MSLVSDHKYVSRLHVKAPERSRRCIQRSGIYRSTHSAERAHRILCPAINAQSGKTEDRAHCSAKRSREVEIGTILRKEHTIDPKRSGSTQDRPNVSGVAHLRKKEKLRGPLSVTEGRQIFGYIIYCSHFMNFVKGFCDTDHPFGRFFFGNFITAKK